MTCFPPLPEDIRLERKGSELTYRIPFFYIIPNSAHLSDHELPVSCWTLPPSTGGLFFYTNTWNTSTVPNIATRYTLRAIVTYSPQEAATGQHITAVIIRPIELLPYNRVPPPVNIQGYPGEFTLEVEQPISKYMLGERLGNITVATEEPSPLIYVPGPSAPSTDCIVNISIQGGMIDPDRLRNMTIEVHPTIHTKTYYSANKMPCMPSRHLLAEHGPYLYESALRLEVQKFRDFQWALSIPGIDSSIPNDQCKDSAPPTYEVNDTTRRGSNVSRIGGRLKSPLVSLPWAASHSLAKQEMAWQTVVRIPIGPSHRLYPSFCSQLIARSYSINLRICFGGAYVRKMNLEVPLQVAYPRLSTPASQLEGGNLENQMEEDGVDCPESGIFVSPNCVSSLAAVRSWSILTCGRPYPRMMSSPGKIPVVAIPVTTDN